MAGLKSLGKGFLLDSRIFIFCQSVWISVCTHIEREICLSLLAALKCPGSLKEKEKRNVCDKHKSYLYYVRKQCFLSGCTCWWSVNIQSPRLWHQSSHPDYLLWFVLGKKDTSDIRYFVEKQIKLVNILLAISI